MLSRLISKIFLLITYLYITEFSMDNKPCILDVLTAKGPHHFPETSFHRIVVSQKRHVVECQLVESLYCRIENCRNYIMSNVI